MPATAPQSDPDAPTTYVLPGAFARLRSEARERGALPVAAAAPGWGLRYAAGLPRTVAGTRRGFDLGSERYTYFCHRDGWTWLNERAVEVPIARRAVERSTGGRVLEVGNVLGHYQQVDHLVVDKYEQAPDVLNVDVLDFSADAPFDLIVSVSTLEHVGWDESPRDPTRALAAVDHMTGLLAPGGELLLTVPVGYNPPLDAAIRDGRLRFDDLTALRRAGPPGLRWREVAIETVWDAPYDRLSYTAAVVLVARRRA